MSKRGVAFSQHPSCFLARALLYCNPIKTTLRNSHVTARIIDKQNVTYPKGYEIILAEDY